MISRSWTPRNCCTRGEARAKWGCVGPGRTAPHPGPPPSPARPPPFLPRWRKDPDRDNFAVSRITARYNKISDWMMTLVLSEAEAAQRAAAIDILSQVTFATPPLPRPSVHRTHSHGVGSGRCSWPSGSTSCKTSTALLPWWLPSCTPRSSACTKAGPWYGADTRQAPGTPGMPLRTELQRGAGGSQAQRVPRASAGPSKPTE